MSDFHTNFLQHLLSTISILVSNWQREMRRSVQERNQYTVVVGVICCDASTVREVINVRFFC